MFTFVLALAGAASSGLALASGLAVSARLRQNVSHPMWVTLINFVIGLVLLAALLGAGAVGPVLLANLTSAPWWAFLGGAFGATYVTLSLVAAGRLGIAASTVAVAFGQIGASLLIDALGLATTAYRDIRPATLIGTLLLLVSVALLHSDGQGARRARAA